MTVKNEYPYDDYIVELQYFSHRVSTPCWRIVSAPLREIDLTYVVGGKAEYTVNGVSHILKAGDIIYIPKGYIRSARTFENDLMEAYCLNFQLKNKQEQDVELPFPRVSSIGINLNIISLLDYLNNDYYKRDPGYRMQLRGWMQLILHAFLNAVIYKNTSSVLDNRIDKVLRYISKHYSEDLSIQNIAPEFGLSQTYFGTLFTRATGMSFRHYLMMVRLNAAENILLSGEYNVNDVALACGFSDTFYFSKAFKASRGVSPSSIIPFEPEISRHVPGRHAEDLETFI